MVASSEKKKKITLKKFKSAISFYLEKMKLQKIYLKNFKRFTELTIKDIPQEAKVVILAGPNGCGKSSIFDAFERLAATRKHGNIGEQPDYHRKDQSQPAEIQVSADEGREFSIRDPSNIDPTLFYIRSPYRYVGEIRMGQISPLPELKQDDDRPKRTIDVDSRLTRNYQRLIVEPISKLYKQEYDDKTGKQIREKYLIEINASLKKILGDLQISDLGDPLDNQRNQLYFSKGLVTQFPFKNLGSGEKEVVDLIIDFVIKKQTFNDTIYCIDEPDLHINTAIQSNLFKELLESLPEKCQLWISTHSLGFIEEAFKSDNAVIIDFSDKDFDTAQVLTPVKKTKENFRKIYKVALEGLVDFIIPQKIVFCEGENQECDEKLFRLIFKDDPDFKDVEFISSKSSLQTKAAVLSVLEPIQRGLSPKRVIAVVDRDYRTEKLVEENQSDYIKILKMYSLENYLLHPNNVKNFKSIEEDKFTEFLVLKINEHREKLKEKIRRGAEKIRSDVLKQQITTEIENNNLFLKMKEVSKGNLEEMYPYIPMKELLGEVVNWYNGNYRKDQMQYSSNIFLEELAEVLGKSRENSSVYQQLKNVLN